MSIGQRLRAEDRLRNTAAQFVVRGGEGRIETHEIAQAILSLGKILEPSFRPLTNGVSSISGKLSVDLSRAGRSFLQLQKPLESLMHIQKLIPRGKNPPVGFPRRSVPSLLLVDAGVVIPLSRILRMRNQPLLLTHHSK